MTSSYSSSRISFWTIETVMPLKVRRSVWQERTSFAPGTMFIRESSSATVSP